MNDIFNNREIATIICISVCIGLALKQKKVRGGIPNLFRLVFKWKIITPFVIMAFYIVGIIYMLWWFNLWNISLLKDTIVWYFFSGIVLAFRSIANNGNKWRYKNILYDSIKLVIIIEFLANTYVFPLIFELILVPFMTLVLLINAVAEVKKYSSVMVITQKIITYMGVIVIGYIARRMILEYQAIISLAALKSFLLPIILTIAILPFIYLLLLYSEYESIFNRLNIGIEKSTRIKNKAKFSILSYCLFDLNKIKAFSNMSRYDVMRIKDEQDIKEMIQAHRNTSHTQPSP